MNRWVAAALCGVLVISGAVVIGFAVIAGDAPAPLPEQTWQVESPVPEPTVDVEPTDSDDGPVTPDTMGLNRLLIPSLDVYAEVTEEWREDGWMTLPPAKKVGRYGAGATVDSDMGTLLLAGHVSSYGTDGALKWLANIKPGARFYVTDAFGNRADFVADRLDTFVKSALPSDVFDATGPRRAVLVTCGGPLVKRADGHRGYRDNVALYGHQVGSKHLRG